MSTIAVSTRRFPVVRSFISVPRVVRNFVIGAQTRVSRYHAIVTSSCYAVRIPIEGPRLSPPPPAQHPGQDDVIETRYRNIASEFRSLFLPSPEFRIFPRESRFNGQGVPFLSRSYLPRNKKKERRESCIARRKNTQCDYVDEFVANGEFTALLIEEKEGYVGIENSLERTPRRIFLLVGRTNSLNKRT